MVSMKDIAAACGVSVATVSKALNNHSDIGAETRKRVRNAAKELGYHPNLSARALKTNKSYNLGVLYKEESGSGLTHDYFSQVLENFKNTAEHEGYDITFLSNSKSRKDRMSYLEHTIYRGMDGVMIAIADYKDPEVSELLRSDLPVVIVDYVFNGRISILSNNILGMEMLLSYIYEHYMETVTLEDIARAADIGKSEAGRCFNMYMGCSPVEALIRYRLQIAHRLLNETNLTLQEISFECGFHSVNYFSRQFRKNYGCALGNCRLLGK